MQTNIIIAKSITVDDSYAGKCTAFLTDQDTLTIARSGRSSIRWSVYLYDDTQNNMFMTQITSNGDRYGLCYLDPSDFPSAEIVKSLSISPDAIPILTFIGPLPGAEATSQIGTITVSDTVVGPLPGSEAISQVGASVVTII